MDRFHAYRYQQRVARESGGALEPITGDDSTAALVRVDAMKFSLVFRAFLQSILCGLLAGYLEATNIHVVKMLSHRAESGCDARQRGFKAYIEVYCG